MGLLPAEAEVGDLVVAFLGGKAPFCVRRNSDKGRRG